MIYKILLVDDDKEIVEVLKESLLRRGYPVAVAFDGEEALLKLKEEDPDIILLDLILPKLNGFEVLKKIREKHNEKWRPVIIISAKTELDSMQQCYSLEADHYLTKPVELEKVFSGVETMISLIPLRRRNDGVSL